MTGGDELGGPGGPRLVALGRRYYPLGIAGAFLATVVGFFPSVAPLGVGGALLFGGGARPARPAAPQVAALAAPAVAGIPGFAASGGADLGGPSAPVPGLGPSPADAALVPAVPAGQPGGAPAPACPVPVPDTGTALDPVLSEVATLCSELAAAFPAVPGLPAGPGPAFVVVDQGAAGPGAAAGTVATVLVGLADGVPIPAALPAATTRLRAAGASVDVVLLVVPGAGDGPGFGAWAGRTAARFPGVQALAVGVPAPGRLADAAVVAAEALDGLHAVERAAPGLPAGLWWEDGGTGLADMAVWRAMSLDGQGLAPGQAAPAGCPPAGATAEPGPLVRLGAGPVGGG